LSAAAFLQRYREVTVEVDLSDRPVDLLGEGYDLALRIGMLEDSTLIARRIASIERVYCASPAYLASAARRSTRRPAQPRLPALRPRSSGAVALQRGQGKPLLVNVTGRMRVNNGELLKDAAIAGMGITYLPTSSSVRH
jgi:DNA-binding transcriptional LysR family regulator